MVQFAGQIFAIILLRRRCPEMHRPYRIWLYPLPCLIALAGWMFVFATSGQQIMLFSLAALALGLVAFLIWSFWCRQWPFEVTAETAFEAAEASAIADSCGETQQDRVR